MPDPDVDALRAECVRLAGATLGWRSRASMIGDDKLHEFAERAGAIAMALNEVLGLHSDSNEDHFCPSELVGYSVQSWHAADDPCPTLRAIARELGVEADGD